MVLVCLLFSKPQQKFICISWCSPFNPGFQTRIIALAALCALILQIRKPNKHYLLDFLLIFIIMKQELITSVSEYFGLWVKQITSQVGLP